LFTIACAHNIERIEEQNYVPAVLKSQPRIIYPMDAQEKSFSGSARMIISISDVGTVGKVFLEKSSGYEILDNAAIEYCKNLVFVPAKVNDKPVYSRLRWEFKFNISGLDESAKKYIYEIKNLYNALGHSSSSERKIIEQEILMKHNNFVEKMTDALNFNSTSEQVILPEISAEWKKDWNNWPLSFLLYYDFLVRFPEYDNQASVKTQLVKSIKYDIQYIRNTPDLNSDVKTGKENILMRIKSFISNHYPDITLDDLGLEKGNDLNPLTYQQSFVYR
jgi:TonB family protein